MGKKEMCIGLPLLFKIQADKTTGEGGPFVTIFYTSIGRIYGRVVDLKPASEFRRQNGINLEAFPSLVGAENEVICLVDVTIDFGGYITNEASMFLFIDQVVAVSFGSIPLEAYQQD